MGMSGAPFGQQYGQPGVQQMGPVGVNGQQLPNKTALSNNLAQFPAELKGTGTVPNMVSVLSELWEGDKGRSWSIPLSNVSLHVVLSVFKNALLFIDHFASCWIVMLLVVVLDICQDQDVGFIDSEALLLSLVLDLTDFCSKASQDSAKTAMTR